jgi:hypothetical protein
MVEESNQAVLRLLQDRDVAVVPFDTRINSPRGVLRTPNQVEALVSRMDVVITTRLHGLVLALRNDVPVIAIDPVPGGYKILPQAERIGWPKAFDVKVVDDRTLADALEWCLTGDAKIVARRCALEAQDLVTEVGRTFVHKFQGAPAAVIATAGPGIDWEPISNATLDLFPSELQELRSWARELREGLDWWKNQSDAWEATATDLAQRVAGSSEPPAAEESGAAD